ncbi:MAG: 30S ribosomal protein S7 [Candidatus Delongbacteria bacterium]
MRRRRAPERVNLPDPKFHSQLAARFINSMMKGGEKAVAEREFYRAVEIVDGKMDKGGLEVFERAVRTVEPLLEVRSRRVGGSTYQVPVEVRPKRKTALAIRWIITYSRNRSEKTFAERLAGELMAAYKKEGNSFKKREDVHKMAEANKAFAHFRW